LARQMRSGMTSINSALTFAGMPGLPFGGVGNSGFGRIHGADGLREFTRPKSIVKRRAPTPLAAMTFDRKPKTLDRMAALLRLLRGRSRWRCRCLRVNRGPSEMARAPSKPCDGMSPIAYERFMAEARGAEAA